MSEESNTPSTPEKPKQASGYVALNAKVAALEKAVLDLKRIVLGFDLPIITSRIDLLERKVSREAPEKPKSILKELYHANETNIIE